MFRILVKVLAALIGVAAWLVILWLVAFHVDASMKLLVGIAIVGVGVLMASAFWRFASHVLGEQ